MNYLKQLLFIAAWITLGSAAFAQDSFEGTIVYEITYEDLDEMMAQYEAMLPKEMTMIFKDPMSKMIQPNGMGQQVVITNNDKKTSTILMDMMGNKIAYEQDLNKQSEAEKDNKVNIKYLDETKTIAGYKCKKAEITVEGMDEKMIAWYTEDIKASGDSKRFGELKGFPLQYEMMQQNFTMILTAKSVKKEKISKAEFKIPKEYEQVTEEEFKQMMSGAAGGK